MWRNIQNLRRDTLMVVSAVLLFGVGVPVVFFVLMNSQLPLTLTIAPATDATVPFTKLTAGRQSAVAKRVNYVITSPAQLSEIWKIVEATGTPPKVDFKKQAVIAVFAGNESSSSIAVAKIEDTNKRIVSIAITKPDCAPMPSAASPYEIIAVPATSLPLTHTDINTIITCKR